MINKIVELIKKSNTIALFSHINSDPDAVGSCIALKLMLEQFDKNVDIFIEEPISDNFDFLGVKQNVNLNRFNNYDLAICLDCPNPKRFGKYLRTFYKIKNSINIDHHPDNEKFAKLNYVDSNKSSTCSILFFMFTKLNLNITKDIATCLYAGICGDTGRFKNSNTKSEDFFNCGNLMNDGAEISFVNENFCKMKLNEYNLLKLALNKTLFMCDNRCAYIFLSISDLKSVDCTMENTRILIDYLRNIDTVKIAVVMTQEKVDECRVSIRSKDNYSAQNVAKCFGGGGHILASGCRIFCEFDKAQERIIEAVCQEDKRCKEL